MTDLSKYSASGSMAGYLFQSRLALLRGLELTRKNPEAIISIEKFDDIAFETDDYVNCLIQAKHHTSPKPLSDSSSDVWKTLNIWMESANRSVFDFGKTTYMLITTSECPEDSAMYKFREGASKNDVEAAYDLLAKAAQTSQNKATQNARSAFLNLSSDEAKLILSRIQIFDLHPNLTDVSSEIASELNILAPNNPELAAQTLEGWWLSRVCQHLLGDNDQGIPVQHLIRKANEIGRSLANDALPIHDPSSLSVKEYSTEDETKIFVKQMRAIEIPDEIVRNATSDFYRAYAQRSRWSRENLILEDELFKGHA